VLDVNREVQIAAALWVAARVREIVNARACEMCAESFAGSHTGW